MTQQIVKVICQISLTIPNGQSEAVSRRGTDNIMYKYIMLYVV